jgi:DNA-binding CsgD family transcriptional regulator
MADPRGRLVSGGPSAVDAGIRTATPPVDLVGRRAEIASIVRWYQSDGAATLLLEGPPGLGKTTVWSAATTDLRASGAHVLSSAPTEAESRLSYSGLADLLTADLGEIRAQLPVPQARALAVALRLEDPEGRPADETAVTRGALEALLAIGTLHGRVLLAIDDLRWLDEPSLATVVYVARRLGPTDPVRILATHRTGAPEPAGLGRAIAIERITLGPLSVGGIHRIVRQHAGVSLSRPRLLEIHAVTLGNPLHAVELARALGSVGNGGPPDDGSLASLFSARIDALPGRSREALVLIGASADRSTGRLESAWAGGSGDGFADAIAPAMVAELVTIAGGQVRPAHPLVTHIAYDTADGSLRRTVHQALARTATDDEERALHLGRAVDGPDAAAADLIEAVARHARVRGVRSLSATLFESAARITPEDQPEDGARRWLAAASAWFDAGDTHRVEVILEPVIEAWPAGARRAEARWRLGIALDEAGRWPEANVLWRAAIEDTDDRALVAQVECSLAITAMYTDSVPVAIDWAAAAAADAERSGDPAALARALAVHAFILAMAGRPSGQASMDRALAIEATIDEHLGEWSPAALAAEVARHTGDIPAALRYYATVLDRATLRGDANIEPWAAFGLGIAWCLACEIGRASDMADLVIDIAEQTDVMRIPARSLRAHVDAYLGRIPEARAMLAEAMSMARAGDETTHLFGAYVVLGTIETCAGDAAGAADAFQEARSYAERLGLAHATVLRTHLLEVEAAAAAGRGSQAADALAAYDRLVASPPRWAWPIRRRAWGALLAARGEVALAIPELEASIADEVALPPDVGRALLALATALRRDRRYREARETAERAVALFAALGTPPFVAMAEREVTRIPGRRAAGDRELTAAEQRIAELVAEGRSNKDVAAELVLSVKTVEVTLTRVYEKLGVRSRSELAAHFRAGPTA